MMKKLLITLCFIVFYTCDRNDDRVNCNFLLNVGVNATVNLNLPQFNQLQFPVNAVRLEGFGNEGIILVRANSSTLLAWDGADPSHVPSACSALEINGINAVCGCEDGNEYSLVTGTAIGENTQPCTLKPYRVENIGNNTYIISN
ncbi:hypothetical protein [Winogradskyella ursingii]|uniref:hypothetical protein n=1 Tax=Winogradskyella ursingii TaxID=2686079 RepID=UPI0015C91602|nr:hypothetical protein [Winogradskyella ursingii]